MSTGGKYRKVQRYTRKVGLGFRTPKEVSSFLTIFGSFLDQISKPNNSFFHLLGRWRQLRRQEMSIHRWRLHPWPYSSWCYHQDEDATYYCYSTWLSSLYSKIQSFWKATQEHVRSSLTMLQVCSNKFFPKNSLFFPFDMMIITRRSS